MSCSMFCIHARLLSTSLKLIKQRSYSIKAVQSANVFDELPCDCRKLALFFFCIHQLMTCVICPYTAGLESSLVAAPALTHKHET